MQTLNQAEGISNTERLRASIYGEAGIANHVAWAHPWLACFDLNRWKQYSWFRRAQATLLDPKTEADLNIKLWSLPFLN